MYFVNNWYIVSVLHSPSSLVYEKKDVWKLYWLITNHLDKHIENTTKIMKDLD